MTSKDDTDSALAMPADGILAIFDELMQKILSASLQTLTSTVWINLLKLKD